MTNQVTEIVLAKCPFCKSDARYYEFLKNYTSYVNCSNSGCLLSQVDPITVKQWNDLMTDFYSDSVRELIVQLYSGQPYLTEKQNELLRKIVER